MRRMDDAGAGWQSTDPDGAIVLQRSGELLPTRPSRCRTATRAGVGHASRAGPFLYRTINLSPLGDFPASGGRPSAEQSGIQLRVFGGPRVKSGCPECWGKGYNSQSPRGSQVSGVPRSAKAGIFGFFSRFPGSKPGKNGWSRDHWTGKSVGDPVPGQPGRKCG